MASETSSVQELQIEIQQLKKDRESILASEERFRAIFENSQEGILLGLPDGTILTANPAACRIFGRSAEEISTLGRRDIVDVADPRVKIALEEREKTGSFHTEMTLIRKGGTKFPGEVSSTLFKESSGRILASFIVRDISESKLAEAALRSSEELFNRAFNANPLAMGIVSIKEGVFLKINSSFGDRTGYQAEFNQPGSSDRILWADIKDRQIFFDRVIKEEFVRNYETRILSKTGEMMIVLLSGVIIDWKGEPCILAVANDITELRRYQMEVARLDRLNLIGEMSASIAHEIRNPLTTVRGFLQLFESQEGYINNRQYVSLMIEELDRANGIITQFLSLAKNKIVDLELHSLNENILTLLPLLQAQALKNDISIELRLGDIPQLMMDRNEIRQLVLNLVLNGIDAMPQGGDLQIGTEKVGTSVILTIKDQGSGMSDEVLKKIGTPFFTTKSGGTGMGLAVCYSIALRHRARIDVNTGPDGSVFKVTFPIEA